MYVLHPMRRQDIAQVMEIDRRSFPCPWSANQYAYEIAENPTSYMVVLTAPGQKPPSPIARPGLFGLLDRLRLRRSGGGDTVVGYGGFWYGGSQAHISTIAVHPAYRGKGLGELLLAGMVRRAITLGARYVSLEVRVSNQTAINLYLKYEFAQCGRKTAYYRDNGEDAYDLRIHALDDGYRARFDKRWKALQARVAFVDRFSNAPEKEKIR